MRWGSRGIAGVGVLVLTLACACAAPVESGRSTFAAEGVYVRHLRVRLAPAHTQAFEAMMRRCVEAAGAARSELQWLCYREPPGRYWLLLFSETVDGFGPPETLAGFAGHVGSLESESARAEIGAMLAGLEMETEWEVLSRQKASWSTVEEVSTDTHPMARIMDRTVRPGLEVEFEAALAARTAFLAERGYPLPIEGFAVRRGAPGRAWQVVFPVDWSSFHETDSFWAFVQRLDEDARQEYAVRKAALMATMSCAEYYDGAFVPELSHLPE